MAPFAWNIRNLHSYSVPFTGSENRHLVRNLVRIVSRFLVCANENAAKWRRVSDLIGGADGARTRDLQRDRLAF